MKRKSFKQRILDESDPIKRFNVAFFGKQELSDVENIVSGLRLWEQLQERIPDRLRKKLQNSEGWMELDRLMVSAASKVKEFRRKRLENAYESGDAALLKEFIDAEGLPITPVDGVRAMLIQIGNLCPDRELTVRQMMVITRYKGDVSDFRKMLKDLGIEPKPQKGK